jgi:hypothetical protein
MRRSQYYPYIIAMAVVVAITLAYLYFTRKKELKKNSVANLNDSKDSNDIEAQMSDSQIARRNFIKQKMESGKMTRDLRMMAK